MKVTRDSLADLDCVVVRADGQQPVDRVALFCHGYGAPGDDLVGVAQELIRSQPERLGRTEFVFPAAPLELDWDYGYDARAWWPINMAQLQEMAMRGDLSDMETYVPPEMAACREQIEQLIRVRLHEHGLAETAWWVGGFSQGAMLAVDVALQAEQGPRGLVIWSGALLAADRWRRLAIEHPPIQVVQSHGTLDPVLPFQAGERLKDLLMQGGHRVEFLPFMGPHTISSAAIAAAAALLAQ